VKLAADMDQTAFKMNALIRNTEMTKKVMEDMRKIQEDSPFSFTEIADANRKLIAMSGNIQASTVALKGFTDIAAGAGTDVNTVIDKYVKMLEMGKVTMKDLVAMQQSAIPVVDALAKSLGKSREEILKLAREGKIGSGDIQKAFVLMATSTEFFAGAAKRADQTIGGVLGDVTDQLHYLGDEIGKIIVQSFGLKSFAGYITALGKQFEIWLKHINETNPALFKTAAVFTLIAAAIGPAIMVTGHFIQALGFVFGGLKTLSLVIATPWMAWTAAIAAAGVVLLTFFDNAETDSQSFGQGMIQVFEDIKLNGVIMLETAMLNLYRRWLLLKSEFQSGADYQATMALLRATSETENSLKERTQAAGYSGKSIKGYIGFDNLGAIMDDATKAMDSKTAEITKNQEELAKGFGMISESAGMANLDISEAMREMGQSTDESIDQQTAALERLKDHGYIPLQDSSKALSVGIAKDMNDSVRSVVMGTNSIADAFNNMMQRIMDSVANAIYDQTVGNFITGMVGNMGIDSIFSGIFGGGGGGGFGGTPGYSGMFSSPNTFSFGGAFASGGRPPMGVPSLVGEQGPELFIPDQSGTVIPHGASMGMLNQLGQSGQSVQVIQNISITPDLPSTTRRVIYEELPTIKQAAINGIQEQVSRGGRFARNIRGF
jgi:tape measure domain-containing protein